MTPEEALPILKAHSPPGEPWPGHCRPVAKVARSLAGAVAGVGAEVLPPRVGGGRGPLVTVAIVIL